MIEFIDEFIFCTIFTAKSGEKLVRKLSSLQQLQLVQILADYFTGEDNFSLLCSVFMIIFMVQGKDVEYKVNCLAKLLSYGLSVNAASILNFGGVWLTQQTPTNTHSLQVSPSVISDLVTLTVMLVGGPPPGPGHHLLPRLLRAGEPASQVPAVHDQPAGWYRRTLQPGDGRGH